MCFKKIAISSWLIISSISYANINGVIHEDIPFDNNVSNSYGVKDANEFGVKGVTVTAFFNNPIETKTTQTDSNGTWDLNVTRDARIEFSNWPNYLQISPNSKINNSSLQFVKNGDNISFALYNPENYSNTLNKKLIISLQSNGRRLNNQNSALKLVPPSETFQDNTVLDIIDLAKAEEVGSIWGIAYDVSNKTIYTSALLRRHVELGPEGLGAIYQININDINNPIINHFVTIHDVGNNLIPFDRNLSTNAIPSHDPIFEKVARIGLGDIDIDEANQLLYTVNINNNTLIKIDINNPSNQNNYSIGDPFNGCNDVKSWGLTVHQQNVYVGSICTNDLDKGAAISKLVGSNFTTIHKIPLTMDGEQGNYVNGIDKRWHVWEDNYINIFDGVGTRIDYAQPILSDMTFKENGDIMVGFLDRTALQSGQENYSPNTLDLNNYTTDSAGDFFYICKNNNQYFNEGTPECPYKSDLYRGIDTEYFIGDEFYYDNIRAVHEEISLGGIAYQAGSNKLIGTVHNAIDRNRQNVQASSGIIWLNTETGEKTGSKRAVNQANYMGKSGGVGDIEILKSSAPIEIGDRVWIDNNKNGLQDSNEPPISNVEIKLFENQTELATAYTNNDGTYIFSNDPFNTNTDSHKYNVTNLTANKNYTLMIPNVAGSSKQNALNSLTLTVANSNLSTASNVNDSDAKISGNNAIIEINASEIPFSGANNHTFDFGFQPITTYALGDRVWLDSNKDGLQDANESGIANLNVSLYANA
ncbi:MAG TPA: hypothetical protein ENK66_01735, partial [Arcobacter sp.]|nr:hypothetical protein [Arcobacter sp.]